MLAGCFNDIVNGFVKVRLGVRVRCLTVCLRLRLEPPIAPGRSEESRRIGQSHGGRLDTESEISASTRNCTQPTPSRAVFATPPKLWCRAAGGLMCIACSKAHIRGQVFREMQLRQVPLTLDLDRGLPSASTHTYSAIRFPFWSRARYFWSVAVLERNAVA